MTTPIKICPICTRPRGRDLDIEMTRATQKRDDISRDEERHVADTRDDFVES